MDKKDYIDEDLCWAAFRVFDRNGDGGINYHEFLQNFGQEFLGKDLTDVDIVADLAAYTVSEFVDFKTEILASLNAGNDIVIAEFNGTHFVAVDADQNMPGAVGTIGLFELDAAIAAADIV